MTTTTANALNPASSSSIMSIITSPLSCCGHSSGLTEGTQSLNSACQSDILLTIHAEHNGSRGKQNYRVNGEGEGVVGGWGSELVAKKVS